MTKLRILSWILLAVHLLFPGAGARAFAVLRDAQTARHLAAFSHDHQDDHAAGHHEHRHTPEGPKHEHREVSDASIIDAVEPFSFVDSESFLAVRGFDGLLEEGIPPSSEPRTELRPPIA